MPQLRWAAALRPWRKLRAACSRGAAAAQRRGGVGGARAGGEAGAHPQPCTGPATEKELPDDSAATDQYGHTPLFSSPYPHEPCRTRPLRHGPRTAEAAQGLPPCRRACGCPFCTVRPVPAHFMLQQAAPCAVPRPHHILAQPWPRQ